MSLIDSKSKKRLLEMLLERTEHSFSVSELSRLTGISKAQISGIIRQWETIGLVETLMQGRNKLVSINSRFYLLPDLQSISKKGKAFNAPYVEKIRGLRLLRSSDILAVVVFGSRVRNDFVHASDLDILLVLKTKDSSITEKIMTAFVKLSESEGIRFSPTFLTKQEFLSRRKEKDLFVHNILTEGKVLKGERLLGNV